MQSSPALRWAFSILQMFDRLCTFSVLEREVSDSACSNHAGALMTMDESDLESSGSCPFCRHDENCTHLLLVADRTFRTAEGGLLRHLFNARWSTRSEAEDFDEREAFDELLLEVDSLSDAMTDHNHEGGPGMSSSYSSYFVSSEARAKNALTQFAKEKT